MEKLLRKFIMVVLPGIQTAKKTLFDFEKGE